MTPARTLACSLLLLASTAAAQDAQEPAEVTRIRESIPRLQKTLEELRGARFERDVAVQYQSDADFRAFLQRALDEQYPPERAQRDSRLLQALGYLPEGYDLRQGLVEAMSSQALAYYDPEQGTFFVLKTQMPASEVDAAVLHELHHALQDQRHDLAALSAPFEAPDFQNDDQAMAYKFLIEGEAFYVQMRFALEQQAGPRGLAMLDQMIGLYGNTARRELERMERMQMGMMGDQAKAAAEAMEARAKLPGYLYHSIVSPYFKGGVAVHQVFKRGGWETIDGLFRGLPRSTEQLLHPEKVDGGPSPDAPTGVQLPDLSSHLGEGWSLLAANTLGELHLRTLFETLDGREQAPAAAGWDGDRVQAYGKEGEAWAAIAWYLVFDGEGDAKEFAAALNAARKKGPPPLASADVTVHGAHVLVLGGVPEGKLEAVRAAALEGVSLTE